ncbi:tRNA epoxyqueuosine(34) reductase QueG [Chitinibacter sp. FCG-7]|uniref:Epoxyqueuosine reductase n=1 Tax=Chitinibacter mangrovi TaxID=3153927 RepID=A0AAU7FCJ4_9NEIS
MNHTSAQSAPDYQQLAQSIKSWAQELGFARAAISGIDLSHAEAGLSEWLAKGFHGEMDYMARHGLKRARPAELVPGTVSVITIFMPYLAAGQAPDAILADTSKAYISRYALGRDYHKVLRQRLQQLADKISAVAGEYGHRVFVDSAPVLEVEIAKQAGLGWRGKHSLLLNREFGSFYFLGELFTDLPLPADPPLPKEHCGKCTACIEACPTQAIVAPYQVDARRCISYLTIELKGAIPLEFRRAIGNRVYGCDDCQLVCPWNRFAAHSAETDFAIRHGLDDVSLLELFGWTEADFTQKMAGSPIYRIGYAKWLSNLAIGLGNASPSAAIASALLARRHDESELVREHVEWALRNAGYVENE